MAGYEVHSSEELISLKESGVLKKGDVIIHRCPKCGRWVLRRTRRGVSNEKKSSYYSMDCQKCKTEATHLRKFGTAHPFTDPWFRENFLYKGMERKYGPGIKHALQVPELYQQAYESTCKSLNSDHPFSCAEMIERYKAGNLEKYGVEWSFNVPEVKAKSDATMIKRFGVTNLVYSKEFQDYVKTYWKENFGVDNPSQIPETRIKFKDTLLNKTGYSYVKASKYVYYGIEFDSSWELAIWIYCIDHNIPIIRDPSIKITYSDYYGKVRSAFPDFKIENDFVEIKGSQFLDEETGKWIDPFNKKKMSDEQKIAADFKLEAKHQALLNAGVKIMYEKDCQTYIDYCDSMYPGWLFIYRKDNFYNPTYWCFSILNPGYFQPQYYQPLSEKGITPYEMVSDDYQFVSDTKITPFDILH